MELWPKGVAEALQTLGKAHLTEDDPDLEETLSGLGVSVRVGIEALTEDDALIVPMHPLEELLCLVDRLLGPGGCPWDQAQTHESLKRHLLEEAYEVLDAIDSASPEKLREELGDLLLQPLMHGQIAAQFDTRSVASAIVDKLIRRHPHVFGELVVADSDEVLQNWDRIKKSEKEGPTSLLEGVPSGMASLLRAHEVSKRAARVGFEWPDLDAVWAKLEEEVAEIRAASSEEDRASEIGDLLFTVVNLARWYQVEPEEALRQMVNRFSSRFRSMEASASKPLPLLTFEEWDELWEAAKARG